jgi:hypothetical protein
MQTDVSALMEHCLPQEMIALQETPKWIATIRSYEAVQTTTLLVQ